MLKMCSTLRGTKPSEGHLFLISAIGKSTLNGLILQKIYYSCIYAIFGKPARGSVQVGAGETP